MGYAILLAPSHGGCDLCQNCFDDMRIVGNAQLVRDGQQQRVGLRDGLILLELFDQGIRLGGVATAEDRARVRVDESDLVITVTCAPEISVIAIVDQCKNAAADRDARLAFVGGLLPGSAAHGRPRPFRRSLSSSSAGSSRALRPRSPSRSNRHPTRSSPAGFQNMVPGAAGRAD